MDGLQDHVGHRRRLLLEEVGRIVADAKTAGSTIRAGYHAGMLAAAYPEVFSIGRIVDELVLAATKEGVAIEMSRPE